MQISIMPSNVSIMYANLTKTLLGFIIFLTFICFMKKIIYDTFFDISNRNKQGFWKASLQALPKPFFLEVKDIMWHLLEGELKVPLTCLVVDRVQNQYLELP